MNELYDKRHQRGHDNVKELAQLFEKSGLKPKQVNQWIDENGPDFNDSEAEVIKKYTGFRSPIKYSFTPIFRVLLIYSNPALLYSLTPSLLPLLAEAWQGRQPCIFHGNLMERSWSPLKCSTKRSWGAHVGDTYMNSP